MPAQVPCRGCWKEIDAPLSYCNLCVHDTFPQDTLLRGPWSQFEIADRSGNVTMWMRSAAWLAAHKKRQSSRYTHAKAVRIARDEKRAWFDRAGVTLT